MDERAEESCSWSGSTDTDSHDSVPDERRGEEPLVRLARAIETEIIPRLMVTLGSPGARSARPADAPSAESGFAPLDIGDFTQTVLTRDMPSALAQVEALRERGLTVEALCLHLLAPTARRLGEMWEADTADFSAVTVALGRLQQVLRAISPGLGETRAGNDGGRRAVLVPAPGDQHTFGLSMVGEFFLREGWEVWGGPLDTPEHVTELVEATWFDLLGLSLSRECLLDSLRSYIQLARNASRNKSLAVMVGGRVFAGRPDLAMAVGADATAADGRAAPIEAGRLVDRMAGRT